MTSTHSKLPLCWAVALVFGLFFLSASCASARSERFLGIQPSRIVKYSESYIVRYQRATCEGRNGKLILIGSSAPIILSDNGKLQVNTSAVSFGPKRPQEIWNQTLREEPRTYAIQRFTGETFYDCINVNADYDASAGLGMDSCRGVISPSTDEWFDYQLVKRAPGCASNNKNGYAVLLRARSPRDIGSNLCVSARNIPGLRATVELCNKADENQLFFINVPSIKRCLK